MICRIKKNKIHIYDFLEYLFVIIMILDGNSVYHALADRNYHLSFICSLLCIFLFFMYPPKGFAVKRRDAQIAFALLIYALIYIPFNTSTMAIEAYVTMYIIGLPVLFLMLCKKKNNNLGYTSLFCKISSVVLVLAIISLFFWIIGSLLHVIDTNTSFLISWGREKIVHGYYGIHFNVQVENTFGFWGRIIRNTGFFTEAPMFNLWLNIALMTELFLCKKISKIKVTILSITVLTTISTTGMIFLVLCVIIIVYITSKETTQRSKTLLIITIIPVVVVLASIIIMFLFSAKSDTHSYSVRLAGYLTGIRAFCKSPLFGTGFGDVKIMGTVLSGELKGFSNSITGVLGTGGIWIFIPYVFSRIVPLFSGKISKKQKCFLLCSLYLSVTTIFFARYIEVVFVAYGIYLMTQERDDEVCNANGCSLAKIK